MSTRERFFSKVDSNGPVPAHCPELGPCHVWTAYRDKRGYGSIKWNRVNAMAPRVAFLLEHGRWPSECALHRCDNPSCVNPAHLFEGTKTENMTDKVKKGRQARGAAIHGRLSEQDVRDIRANYALCRVTQRELGERFGVTDVMVSRIVNGKAWAHA